MNILLVNDDGIYSDGIWALFNSIRERGHEVWMVAPKFEQSAKSHSITTRDPLRIEKKQEGVWSVNGTPADCVIVAFEHLLVELGNPPIDLVVSGINNGQNIGDDVLYSGTVAAAIEAMCFGYKSIALSIASYHNQIYETAVHVFWKLIENGIENMIGHREIFNVNIPNVEIKDLKGYVVCQTGFRRYQDMLSSTVDQRNREIFWITGSDPIFEKSSYPIDAGAIKKNKVAISPLKIDFNNYEKINSLGDWAKALSK